MPGGVSSVADMLGVDNLVADVTQNVQTKPGSVENAKPPDSSCTVNNEKAPPVAAEAGDRDKGTDATAVTTKDSDPDTDVSLALTVPHGIRAKEEHFIS
jgi:hypothetical protein